MKSLEMLRAEKVNCVSTKFFYKKRELCYQIMLSYDEHPFLFYKSFNRYSDYRKMHDKIISALNNNSSIPNSFLPVREETTCESE